MSTLSFTIDRGQGPENLPKGPFVDGNGVNHPENVLTLWTDEELLSIGIVRSTEDPEPTFDERREQRLMQLEINYIEKISEGYPKTFGSNNETFQMKSDTDRTNWLTIKGVCEEYVAAGGANSACPLPIRATSNINYQLTNQETLDFVNDLRNWGLMMMGAFWTKKDTINSVANNDVVALNACDITTWPS